MPVDSKHPQYKAFQEKWKKCRTTTEGEEAVKEAATLYLPRLGGQQQKVLGDGDAAYDLNKADEYSAYKERAMFFAGASRTVTALDGAVFRKNPEVTFPKNKEELLESVTWEGSSLLGLSKSTLSEVVRTGRCGLLVDLEKDNSNPYIVLLPTENVTNWSFKMINGREVLTMVVIKERYSEAGADPFVNETGDQYRVLKFDDDNKYVIELWRKDEKTDNSKKETWVLHDTLAPQVHGKRIDYIPFTFVNVSGTSSQIDKPPILDVVNVNLSHYRSSADLEHGLHFTALPTAWAAGFDVDEELRIGSQTAWVSEHSDSHAGFLEFSGAGLSAIERAMDRKEKLMAVLGARLLEDDKKAVEAAETHHIRRSGEQSVLASIASSVEEGITIALTWFAEWQLITGDIEFVLNRDFTGGKMDAATITALFSVYLGKGMSWDSLIHNYNQGELLPEGRTAEEEAALIDDDGGPTSVAAPMDLDATDDADDGEDDGEDNTTE